MSSWRRVERKKRERSQIWRSGEGARRRDRRCIRGDICKKLLSRTTSSQKEMRCPRVVAVFLPLVLAASLPGQSGNDPSELSALRDRVEKLEVELAESKESSDGLHAGWDGKFFIRAADQRFRLNLGAYTQFRWEANVREEAPAGEDDVTDGFTVRRTRVFMEGQYTELFGYHLRLNIDDQGDVSLTNAYVQWNIDERWSVRTGEQFLALSREDWMYALDVLASDFSANDFEFAIGTSLGIQAHYQEESFRGPGSRSRTALRVARRTSHRATWPTGRSPDAPSTSCRAPNGAPGTISWDVRGEPRACFSVIGAGMSGSE